VRYAAAFACSLFMTSAAASAADWTAARGPLATRWAKEVSPRNAHPEYPRPQMVRKEWLNLNGLWDYAVRSRNEERPGDFDGKILVPFPIESALSGVMKRVDPKERLWYRRTFRLPDAWRKGRVLLHFGAVDWEAFVWVNGQKVVEHRGGYNAFTADITSALVPGEEQEVVVAAWDPTDAGFQPRGKQVRRPGGIWYTPTTGIWQTVWAEPVPVVSIDRLELTPDVDSGSLKVKITTRGPAKGCLVRVVAKKKGHEVAEVLGQPGRPLELIIKNAKLWSPSNPFLYDLSVYLRGDAGVIDTVESYFGMRKIALGKDEDGTLRLFLNNKKLFQFGPLDQGFWPDGIYTAPTDEALKYDIEVLKRLGFNMARKHVKIEPDRWYYWCDKLGLMVWQDMPSGDRYIGHRDPDVKRVAQSARQFELELKRTIDQFYNHPCIVMWVPFNEGWGQYDTKRITSWIKSYDPTRLVNNTSGWADRGVGDVHDIHRYPGPGAPPNEEKRAAVLGEFGGLGLPLKGHTWQAEKNWGYRSFKTREELTEAYINLINRLIPLIGTGLSAAVYTQTTDVEIEVNGLMTYDRGIIKMDPERIGPVNLKVYLPPPLVRVLVPTSRKKPQSWLYTTEDPGPGWEKPDFSVAGWKTGPGGFGKPDTPGAVIGTEWTTSDIWLRRTFELPWAELKNPHLLSHHDEDAEVYLNGVPAAKLTGYTADYIQVPLSAKARAALKKGKNVIAVHCRQTAGGQYIDVGIGEVIERKE